MGKMWYNVSVVRVSAVGGGAFYGSPGVYLNDCEFRNMNDDGGNCHMKAQPVLAKLGPHTLVHRTHGGKVRPGEMLRLYHALDGSVAADLTIASTRWDVWKEGASPAFVTETVEEIPTGVITEADVPVARGTFVQALMPRNRKKAKQ